MQILKQQWVLKNPTNLTLTTYWNSHNQLKLRWRFLLRTFFLINDLSIEFTLKSYYETLLIDKWTEKMKYQTRCLDIKKKQLADDI